MNSVVDRMRKAILTNKKSEVEKLLHEGFPLDEIVFYQDVAAIHYAVKESRHDILDLLLKAGANVDIPTLCDKSTALHLACWEGDRKSVERLLTAGASPSATDKDGFTPVMQALRNSKTAKLLPLLLEAGGSVATLKNGRSPIHQTYNHEDPAAIYLLVAAGAEVNASMEGVTPLMKVIDELAYHKSKPTETKISRARLPIIEALIQCGADPLAVASKDLSQQKTAGRTIIEIARQLELDLKIIAALESTPEKKPTTQKLKDQKLDRAGAKSKPKSDKPPIDPDALWPAIVAHLKASRPAIVKTLQRGATEKQIESVQALSKYPLPVEFRKLWEINNGQRTTAEGLFSVDHFDDEYRLLSTTDIVREWKAWNELLSSGEFSQDSVTPDPGVRAAWYNQNWIPIASNTGGDFFCLDLSPAKGGKRGQVISLKHDSPERTVVAKSVTELLWRVIDHE